MEWEGEVTAGSFIHAVFLRGVFRGRRDSNNLLMVENKTTKQSWLGNRD